MSPRRGSSASAVECEYKSRSRSQASCVFDSLSLSAYTSAMLLRKHSLSLFLLPFSLSTSALHSLLALSLLGSVALSGSCGGCKHRSSGVASCFGHRLSAYSCRCARRRFSTQLLCCYGVRRRGLFNLRRSELYVKLLCVFCYVASVCVCMGSDCVRVSDGGVS